MKIDHNHREPIKNPHLFKPIEDNVSSLFIKGLSSMILDITKILTKKNDKQ